MAKKKAAKKKKGAKTTRPTWLSDEAFAVTQDLARLVEHFTQTATVAHIDADLAGVFLWRMLFPSDKKTAQKREEATKLGLIESSVKLLASTSQSVSKTSIIGILTTLVETPAGRDAFFSVKGPSPLSLLLNCADHGNVCLAAYTCKLLARLASSADSRLRVMKGLQHWNWQSLARVLRYRKVTSSLGGDEAISDAVTIVAALCCSKTIPENVSPESYIQLCATLYAAVLDAEIVEQMTDLLADHVPNRCKASTMQALKILFREPPSFQAKRIFLERRGRQSAINLLRNPFFSLPTRAAIAECLCLSFFPDASIEDTTSMPPSVFGALTRMPEGFESDDTVPLLLNLCLGPDGPLREITTAGAACLPLPSADMAMCLSGLDSAAPQPTSKKKGKAKKKKRKATKLEAGMADAQTHASGCLRILSLNASGQCAIARHGGIRYLAPLLSSNIQQARWNARQVLLSLASDPDCVQEMEKYRLPKYITRRTQLTLSLA